MRAFEAESMVAYPLETLLAAAALILGGVCDRFPDLRIVLLHGGGHFPYQAGRLSRGYEVREAARGQAEHPPSDYLSWFWYDSLVYLPRALRFLIDLVGADRVMLGSDTPFDMGPRQPADILHECGCTAAEWQGIARVNAADLFGGTTTIC